MLREAMLGDFEHLKNYLQKKSEIEVDEGDVFILASTLEEPLTMEEVCYSTGLKITTCDMKIRKLLEAGLLSRFDPKSPEGKKRGGLFVYQISDDIASDLGAFRQKIY